ncbi:MAG TPA: zinc-dependent metalloprotease [Phycisphaerae bacterium]|nr:zinc-dependent metalloprotease [Phycisphaerae bacterium]
MTRRLLLGCMIVGCVWLPVSAEPPPEQTGINIEMLASMSEEIEAVMGGAEARRLPKFEDVTKGMKSTPGLFTLWYYPPDIKDKDPEKLLCQIPERFLGEQFMLSTSISGGGFFTGFPLDERVVRWELQDRQLLLIEPQTRYVADSSKEVSDAVRRTYPDSIRVAVPLVTKSPAGDPVIELGPLLKSNFADIGWMASFDPDDPLGIFMRGARINPGLSKWTKRKSFELNVEIGVELAIAARTPPGSYDKTLVHYSFWKLPRSDYQPRIADDRVGYFVTAHRDWSKSTDERDIFNRYIHRWHLVKRDPSLEMCEPRQPITFYIEKTVPVRYRRAVRDGILEWNKAFEKIGFVNAIEVRQQTDDNEWKDLDPEDMRYSFFRWIVTGAGFAMGPSRANPFTGQLYDADIICDDSMVRYFQQEAETMLLPSALVARKFNDPAMRQFLERFPHWRPPESLEMEEVVGEEPKWAELHERMRQRMSKLGKPYCEYCQGMKHQMQLAGAVLVNFPPEVKERFLYEVLKEVVTHEVGHTLGLRHNFMASSIYSLEEIQKRRTTDAPTCGSIMDYNPVLFTPENPTEGHFITPGIGPYDYWAIEYGYRPYDGSYKSARAEAEKGKGDEKKEKAKDEAEKAGSAADETAQTPQPAPEKTENKISNLPDLSKLPPEIRDKLPEIMAQLPPEVIQMLESGAIDFDEGADSEPPPMPKRGAREMSMPSAPAGEKGMLLDIARRCTEPELAYATDEDCTMMSPDPRVNTFDMSSDPVGWARSRIELVDKRMANILEWAVKDQESWYHLRSAFVTLMFEKATTLDYVGRYVGGQYFTRAHRGDGAEGAPLVLVDAKLQREALRFLQENLYKDDFFQVAPDVLNHLVPPRWYHYGARVSYSMDFPIHDLVGFLQWWNLIDRLYPNTLRRIYDAELKSTAPDRLTAAEYLQTIQDACWSDAVDLERLKKGAWSDAEPFLSSYRRSLQREYLGLMESLVRYGPGGLLPPDVHAMLQYSLQKLSTNIGAVLNASGNKADFASQAHLSTCKSRIDRILTSELREY